MKFQEQANKWLTQIGTRKLNPVRTSTLERYQSTLSTHILPVLGQVDLSQVGNRTLRDLVAGLKLSPAAIQMTEYVVKAVVKSAVDEDGNQMYPRTWNTEFIDAPAITGQKAPELPLEMLQEGLGRANGPAKALYALLAGSGLRISEALSLTAGTDDGESNFWDVQTGTLTIRRSKTDAGVRIVDLDPELNTFLARTLTPGRVFQGSESTWSRRLQADMGCTDFHRFRRFRLTHLDKQNVPDGIKKFWAGHAAGDITSRYVKIGNDIDARKAWAKQAGLGFELC